MPLLPGSRLGAYEILSLLGAGGMGEVYRARDTKLGREVAIKVLPSATLHDDAARARLLREARLAATLNHPNICTVHEVGEADGHVYLAMELIEGQTLRARIAARPTGLPTENVLGYGTQIAAALVHAHDRHVIHRDLKSSNVVVTIDGRVKVLDFGLAQRLWEASDPAAGTLSVELTEAGAVVGTPQYLAPEVLRGGKADERSDLWALGVLLHEMASGTLPFKGATSFELASSILHDVPAALPARLPAGLQGCVRRCLAKEPGERYARASEVRSALEAIDSRDSQATTVPAVKARWLPVALVFLGLAVAGVTVWQARRVPARPRELKQRQLTSYPAGDPVGAGNISPDGKTLAVLDHSGLSLRSIDSGESHPMEMPAGFVAFVVPLPQLCWFPDGSQLLVSGHMADGHPAVWALPVTGGRMRKVLDDASNAVLNLEGTQMAYVRRGERGAEIWVSGVNGDAARRVTGDDSTGVIIMWAVWSPSGKRLAYARYVTRPAGATGPRLESCDLSGQVRVLYTPPAEQPLHYCTVPAWLPDGEVMFGATDPPPSQRDMNLWALRVDPNTGAPSGTPRRVTQWQRLALVLPSAFSADGKRLSVGVLEYQSDIYVGGIAAGVAPLRDVRRMTLDDRMDWTPAWMVDGSTILFSSDRNGTFDIFRQRIDAAAAEPVVTGPGDQVAPRASPDGAWILYRDVATAGSGGTPRSRILRVPASGGPAQVVLEGRGSLRFRCPEATGASSVLSEFENGTIVFSRFDPEHGRGQEIVREPARFQPWWDLSSDGSTLAIVDQQQDSIPRIRLLSTVGAPPHEVRLDRPVQVAEFAYGPDANSWLVVEAGVPWRLLLVDASGRATSLTPPQMWMYSAATSPDGKRIAYTSNTGQGNIWMLEDF